MEKLDVMLYDMVGLVGQQVKNAYANIYFDKELAEGACSVLMMSYSRFEGSGIILELDEILNMLLELSEIQIKQAKEKSLYNNIISPNLAQNIIETRMKSIGDVTEAINMVLSLAYTRK